MNRAGSEKRESTLSSRPCRPWSSRLALGHLHFSSLIFFLNLKNLFLVFQKLPSKDSWMHFKCWSAASCCHVLKLLQSEDRIPTSVFNASEGSKVSSRDLTSFLCASNAPPVHFLSVSAASYRITQCFCYAPTLMLHANCKCNLNSSLKYYFSNIALQQMRHLFVPFDMTVGFSQVLFGSDEGKKPPNLSVALCGQIRSGQSICVCLQCRVNE